MNKVLCILQARMSSTRLPWKVLMKINNIPLLQYEIQRLKKSLFIDKLIIATSDSVDDDVIESFCKSYWIACFRWDLNNVLKRYYDCSCVYNEYDTLVRVTWDCPLIEAKIIDETINLYFESGVDYCTNAECATFPDWLDVEVFSKHALTEAYQQAVLPSEKEHVTPYIRKHFKKINYCLKKEDYSSYRFTVDEEADFALIKLLIEQVWSDNSFKDYIDFVEQNWITINSHIWRNEWAIKSYSADKAFLQHRQ